MSYTILPIPPRVKDITGERFDKLTVLGYTGRNKHGHILWLCECDCGGTCVRDKGYLNRKGEVACGCRRGRVVDLTGKVFGRWTVIERRENQYDGHPSYLCRCECGIERVVLAGSLTQGKSVSCGCYHKEVITKHGEWNDGKLTPEYSVWLSMRRRVFNPSSKQYPNYGGRGITIDSSWDNYTQFLEDMGRRPSPDHSIERVDNDGPYSPSNCVWGTRSEQQRNKRNKNMVTAFGETKHLHEWCEELELDPTVMLHRIKHLGWNTEDALLTPTNKSYDDYRNKR